MVEEYYSPRKNAEDFLANLFKYRSKSNMMSFMAFIVDRLNAYNAATPQNRNYSEKFASLSVLACLADELKQNEVPFWCVDNNCIHICRDSKEDWKI